MRIKKTSQYIEGGAGLPSYFTDEIDTGMKWIDGKPLYRVVVNIGALPNNSSKSTTKAITNLNRIIKMSGYAYNGSTTLTIPYSASNPIALHYHKPSNSVVIETTSDRSAYTETYITIEYTKTTD